MAGTAVLESPARRRASVGSTVLVGAAIGAALMFFFVAAFPYVHFNPQQFGMYWPKRYGLAAHIAAGTVALFLAPIQIWLGVNRRRLELHRALGFTYMTSVAIGSAAAYYLAFNTDGPWVFGMGLVGLATAW